MLFSYLRGDPKLLGRLDEDTMKRDSGEVRQLGRELGKSNAMKT